MPDLFHKRLIAVTTIMFVGICNAEPDTLDPKKPSRLSPLPMSVSTPIFRRTSSTDDTRGKQAFLFFCAGGVMPTGPDVFKDYWNIGEDFGIGARLRHTKLTTVQFDANYVAFSYDKKAYLDELYGSMPSNVNRIRLSGGTLSLITMLTNLRFHFSDTDAKVKGYLIGGLGIGNYSLEDMTVSDGFNKVTFKGKSVSRAAMRLGYGMDIKTGDNTCLFAENDVNLIFTDGDKTAWVSLNLGFGFGV